MTLKESFAASLISLSAALVMPASAQISYDGDADIYIDAEKATYKGLKTILEGAVDVKQGSARILSDIMYIYREETPENIGENAPMGEVSRIEAEGNFRYVTPDSTVTGNRGVYQRSTGIIVVTGNVKVVQASGNSATTDRLTYNVKTETIRFEGDCLGKECKDRPSIRIGN